MSSALFVAGGFMFLALFMHACILNIVNTVS